MKVEEQPGEIRVFFDGVRETKNEYNVFDQLSMVIYPLGNKERFEYDAMNNGIKSTYDYDANGRLKKLNYSSGAEELKNYDFTYDYANNIRTMNESYFDYDNLSESSLFELDFAAGSIGIDMGNIVTVSRIQILPDGSGNAPNYRPGT